MSHDLIQYDEFVNSNERNETLLVEIFVHLPLNNQWLFKERTAIPHVNRPLSHYITLSKHQKTAFRTLMKDLDNNYKERFIFPPNKRRFSQMEISTSHDSNIKMDDTLKKIGLDPANSQIINLKFKDGKTFPLETRKSIPSFYPPLKTDPDQDATMFPFFQMNRKVFIEIKNNVTRGTDSFRHGLEENMLTKLLRWRDIMEMARNALGLYEERVSLKHFGKPLALDEKINMDKQRYDLELCPEKELSFKLNAGYKVIDVVHIENEKMGKIFKLSETDPKLNILRWGTDPQSIVHLNPEKSAEENHIWNGVLTVVPKSMTEMFHLNVKVSSNVGLTNIAEVSHFERVGGRKIDYSTWYSENGEVLDLEKRWIDYKHCIKAVRGKSRQFYVTSY